MNCDNIYVVKDVRIVEEGKHDQLLAQNGYYTQILFSRRKEMKD